jgi:hypothetical protein
LVAWYVESEILSFEDKNKELSKIVQQKKKENEKYTYVEEILSEHYNQLEKFKSIKSPDLF